MKQFFLSSLLILSTGCFSTALDAPEDAADKAPNHPPMEHRASALSCDGRFTAPEPSTLAYFDPEAPNECVQHADCVAGSNGQCAFLQWDPRFYCVYDECIIDDDCGVGTTQVCYCDGKGSARCLRSGNCRTDSDCPDTGYCSPMFGDDCGGYHPISGYACHTSADECIDDDDCDASQSYCNFAPDLNQWICMPIETLCTIG